MKSKPLNAYWASELTPSDIRAERKAALAASATHINTLYAAVSNEKALELEQYRKEQSPDTAMNYPFRAAHRKTAALIAEMDYFLTCSGVRA